MINLLSAIKREILGIMLNSHELDEEQESHLYSLQLYSILRCDCARCGIPIKAWRSSELEEGAYYLQMEDEDDDPIVY